MMRLSGRTHSGRLGGAERLQGEAAATPRNSEWHIDSDRTPPQSRPSLWSRFFSSLAAQCEAAFVDNLPHEYITLLEKSTQVYLGSFFYLAILALGAVIFAYLYDSTKSQVYLSPTFDVSRCQQVDRPATGTYFGDLSGHWSGTWQYDPSKAAYSFQLSNFSVGGNQASSTLSQEWRSIMTTAGLVLSEIIGPIMSKQNLAQNLLYLLTWSLPAITGLNENKQVLSFSGNSTSVFSTFDYLVAGLATSNGVCNISSITTFDAGTHSLTVSYDATEYSNNPHCKDALPITSTNFIVGRIGSPPALSLVIDVRSFFAAVAANHPKPSSDPAISACTITSALACESCATSAETPTRSHPRE